MKLVFEVTEKCVCGGGRGRGGELGGEGREKLTVFLQYFVKL